VTYKLREGDTAVFDNLRIMHGREGFVVEGGQDGARHLFGFYFDWDEIREVPGNEGRTVFLVGEQNFYREYEVNVQTYNDEGDGPMSPTVTIRSAMGMPTVIAQNVRAQPYNATACLVHWEPVPDTREHIRGKLGGYRLSYWMSCCEDEEGAPRVTINGQAEEGLVIALYPNTQYNFDVMVWNQAGNGPKSQVFLQRSLRNSPINMPVEVQIERKSMHGIHVRWRGVSTTQIEEPLMGYAVRIWRQGTDIRYATDYDARKETDLYIEGLRPDILYKLRVYAYSRGGEGTMSSPALNFMTGSANGVVVSSWICIVSLLIAFMSH